MSSGINTVHELLAHPSLYAFFPYFQKTGYDDLSMLVDMDTDGWYRMLGSVESEAAIDGVIMVPGVRERVILRLRQEKIRRTEQAAANNPQSHTVTITTAQQQRQGSVHERRGSAVIDVSHLPDNSGVTKSYVVFQGCTCFDVHWGFCFGCCLLVLVVSLFLLMVNELSAGDDGDGDGNNESGGWKFLYVVMIAGFILSGIMCMCGLCAYIRTAQDDEANTLNCQDSVIVAVILSTCAAITACISRISCPSCERDPYAESCCSSLSIPSCDCDSVKLPRCTCEGFCPSCDDMYCPQMPTCTIPDCNCCPSCNGAKSCFYTTYKIICCQCQIQV